MVSQLSHFSLNSQKLTVTVYRICLLLSFAKTTQKLQGKGVANKRARVGFLGGQEEDMNWSRPRSRNKVLRNVAALAVFVVAITASMALLICCGNHFLPQAHAQDAGSGGEPPKDFKEVVTCDGDQYGFPGTTLTVEPQILETLVHHPMLLSAAPVGQKVYVRLFSFWLWRTKEGKLRLSVSENAEFSTARVGTGMNDSVGIVRVGVSSNTLEIPHPWYVVDPATLSPSMRVYSEEEIGDTALFSVWFPESGVIEKK